MKKSGLTLEEHIQAGQELKAACGVLVKWSVKFSNAYPKNNSAYKWLRKAEDSLMAARSSAEDNLYADCPEQANTKIYYSGNESDNLIELYTLEHSQYSEDTGIFPFHIAPINRTVKRNLIDCRDNHRKKNKWQLIFVGSFEDCTKLMNHLLLEKGLATND